jgi:PKD repeat protein
MTTTQLPFPSDLFLEFLGDHPDAGKYFALGERVIVVLDGVAYETIPGDSADLSNNNIEAQAQAEPLPDPVSAPQSSAQPLPISLTADVTEGVAPLVVNFSGTLANGSEEAEKYACQEGRFEFGDGNSLAVTSAACNPERKRGDIANYVYDKPGEYQVTYSLNDLKSEPLIIIVRSAGDTPSPVSTSKSAVQATPIGSEPGPGTPAEPTHTPSALAPGNSQAANQAAASSIYNVWALVVLPLVGLAAGWFIWGRGRNR